MIDGKTRRNKKICHLSSISNFNVYIVFCVQENHLFVLLLSRWFALHFNGKHIHFNTHRCGHHCITAQCTHSYEMLD